MYIEPWQFYVLCSGSVLGIIGILEFIAIVWAFWPFFMARYE